MAFMDLAESRYSSRKYKATPIEKEKLDSVLEAGRLAPTAKNNQPVKVFAVTSADGLSKVGEAANIYGAPAALVVCADRAKSFTREFDGFNSAEVDASIVTTQMMYQATDLGLGSVWICWFKADVLSANLGIPAELVPINILAMGYRDDDTSKNHGVRKPLDEFAAYL